MGREDSHPTLQLGFNSDPFDAQQNTQGRESKELSWRMLGAQAADPWKGHPQTQREQLGAAPTLTGVGTELLCWRYLKVFWAGIVTSLSTSAAPIVVSPNENPNIAHPAVPGLHAALPKPLGH